MSAARAGRRGLLPLAGVLAALLYLLPKAAGLLDGLGGSHLSRRPVLRLSLHGDVLAATGLFLLLAALVWVARERLSSLFHGFAELADRRPRLAALALAGSLLLLHAAIFLPFRYNALKLPDPASPGFELRGERGRLVRGPRRGFFEDYARNFVTARSIRRLGIGSTFETPRSPALTSVDRYLCEWGLKLHPPGYFLFLAPFTADPVLARASSLLLYALAAAGAFLLLRPLLGSPAAALGTILFWAVPANLFFLGMMTSNDLAVAVPILASLALAAGSPRPSAVRLLLSGFLLGAAVLVKYTAILALPWAAILLLFRLGPRRGLRALLLFLAPFLAVSLLWLFLLSRTEWGVWHYRKYVAGTLSRAVDPSRIGTARSQARGTILDFLAFLPLELGFPLALLTALGLGRLAVRFRQVPAGQKVPVLLYGLSLGAALLTIPKSNYLFFALPGLCAAGASFAAAHPRRRDALVLVLLVLAFGVSRAVLYGLQTW